MLYHNSPLLSLQFIGPISAIITQFSLGDDYTCGIFLDILFELSIYLVCAKRFLSFVI